MARKTRKTPLVCRQKNLPPLVSLLLSLSLLDSPGRSVYSIGQVSVTVFRNETNRAQDRPRPAGYLEPQCNSRSMDVFSLLLRSVYGPPSLLPSLPPMVACEMYTRKCPPTHGTPHSPTRKKREKLYHLTSAQKSVTFVFYFWYSTFFHVKKKKKTRRDRHGSSSVQSNITPSPPSLNVDPQTCERGQRKASPCSQHQEEYESRRLLMTDQW